ncbi:hypothetical protein DB31_7196 [Hyalangium minutum]|uniref:Uncharacterized protein n=1 Tax=Hyalangium minutum TaxID=394096 RepID=A0A085WJU6_9BACT|nr:hypothetical protein DB31_7196 [Hyalangium minutum]
MLFVQVEDEPTALTSPVLDLLMEIEVLAQRLLARDPARRLLSAEVQFRYGASAMVSWSWSELAPGLSQSPQCRRPPLNIFRRQREGL